MKRKLGTAFMLIACLVLLVSVVGCKSEAKAYPSKSIALVYHSSAGSGGDIFLRNLAKALEKQFKQPIVVENRTGGGGSTAWSYVAKAKNDGYTMLGISSTIVAGPIQTKMDVDYKTFKPVAQVFYDPMVIFVSTKSSFNSFADIVKDAKAATKPQKWGGGSPGSVESLCLKQIAAKLGVQFDVVAPLGLDPNEMGWHLQQRLAETGAKRLAVEGADLLAGAFPGRRQGEEFLAWLAQYAPQQGVTALITESVPASPGHGFGLAAVPLATLAQNVLALRYVLQRGHLRRAMAVIKLAGAGYDTAVRELVVGPQGLTMGEVLEGEAQPAAEMAGARA